MAPKKYNARSIPPLQLFCKQLNLASNRKGLVRIPEKTINSAKEVLNGLRDAKQSINSAEFNVDNELVSILDGREDEFCSRLDVKLFDLILSIIIQGDESDIKARGIYLLATSLWVEFNQHSSSRSLDAKKSHICSSQLLPLLDCFVDSSENINTRRWVGILLRELLRGSEKSQETLALCPEDKRRKIGPMIFDEPDEVIRIICGSVLKVSGIELNSCWPVDTDSKLISDFPDSSRSRDEWDKEFQNYLDNISVELGIPDGTGDLYCVPIAVTIPAIDFTIGPINVLIGHSNVTIYRPHINKLFDELLVIPYSLIANVTSEEEYIALPSQMPKHWFHIDLKMKKTSSFNCSKNAAPSLLEDLRFSTQDEDTAMTLAFELNEMLTNPQISDPQSDIEVHRSPTKEPCEISPGAAGFPFRSSQVETPITVSSKVTIRPSYLENDLKPRRMTNNVPEQRREMKPTLNRRSRISDFAPTSSPVSRCKAVLSNSINNNTADSGMEDVVSRLRSGYEPDPKLGHVLAEEAQEMEEDEEDIYGVSPRPLRSSKTLNDADALTLSSVENTGVIYLSPGATAKSPNKGQYDPTPSQTEFPLKDTQTAQLEGALEAKVINLRCKPQCPDLSNNRINSTQGILKSADEINGSKTHFPKRSTRTIPPAIKKYTLKSKPPLATSKTTLKGNPPTVPKIKIYGVGLTSAEDTIVSRKSVKPNVTKLGRSTARAGGGESKPILKDRKAMGRTRKEKDTDPQPERISKSDSNKHHTTDLMVKRPENTLRSKRLAAKLASAKIEVQSVADNEIESGDEGGKSVVEKVVSSIPPEDPPMNAMPMNFAEGAKNCTVFRDEDNHRTNVTLVETPTPAAQAIQQKHANHLAQRLSSIFKDIGETPTAMRDLVEMKTGTMTKASPLLQEQAPQYVMEIQEHTAKEYHRVMSSPKMVISANDYASDAVIPDETLVARDTHAIISVSPQSRKKPSTEREMKECEAACVILSSKKRNSNNEDARSPSTSPLRQSLRHASIKTHNAVDQLNISRLDSPLPAGVSHKTTGNQADAAESLPLRDSTENHSQFDNVFMTSYTLNQTVSIPPLVDEHLFRKPHLIGFRAHGPLNQGSPCSTVTMLKSTRSMGNNDIAEKPQGNKRQSLLPGKRQREETEDSTFQPHKSGAEGQSLPKRVKNEVAIQKKIVNSSSATTGLQQYGSQGSRVTADGSPLATTWNTEQHKNFKNISDRVLKGVETRIKVGGIDNDEPIAMFDHESLNDSRASQPLDEHVGLRDTGISCILSPNATHCVNIRYVGHKMAADKADDTTGTKSLDNVPPQILDPFIQTSPDVRISNFMKRLKAFSRPGPSREAVVDGKPNALSKPVAIEDPEKTLVDVEKSPVQEIYSHSEEMIVSSDDSVDQELPLPQHKNGHDVTPEEQWRNALKPHQQGIVDILHQITNDLVRDLIHHEEAVENVVEAYQRNGRQIVEHAMREHRVTRQQVHRETESLIKLLKDEYSQSQREVVLLRSQLKISPLRTLEKERTERDIALQNMIERGRQSIQ